MGFPGSSAGKESTCNAEDSGSNPGLGNYPREGISYALQYSWSSLGWEDPLEEGVATQSSIPAWRIPMDRGAWWATDHGATKSWS